MRVLVTSEQDIASLTIKEVLLNDYEFSDSEESFTPTKLIFIVRATLRLLSFLYMKRVEV